MKDNYKRRHFESQRGLIVHAIYNNCYLTADNNAKCSLFVEETCGQNYSLRSYILRNGM